MRYRLAPYSPRRLLAALLCFLLCAAAFPLSALAQEADGEAPPAEGQAAQADATGDAVAAGDGDGESARAPAWIDRLKQGGKTMLALLLLSVAGLAVILERLFNLKKSVIVPDGLAREARQKWSQGDYEGVTKSAEGKPSTLGKILREFVNYRSLPASELFEDGVMPVKIRLVT